MKHTEQNPLAHAPLGQTSSYPEHYDASLLFPIARASGRQHLSLQPTPLWHGEDVWRAFEVSWLNPKGKPEVAILCFTIPADSPNIIESKSFKLYLNSFNQMRTTREEMLLMMQHDVSQVAGAPVSIVLESAHTPILPPFKTAKNRHSTVQIKATATQIKAQITTDNTTTSSSIDYGTDGALPPTAQEGELALPAILIDTLDIECHEYEPNADLLSWQSGEPYREETLISELLKSNCPVTAQPDWATLVIRYKGSAIDHASLLRYIVSYRHHSGFHEQCVEQIYCDIWQRCKPDYLDVYARYTRRGGLDINPRRRSARLETSGIDFNQSIRTPRQ